MPTRTETTRDGLRRLAELHADGPLRRDGRAVGGAEGVLAALEQRRVETLLFTRGQQVPDDVLEEAIEAAISQDAEVVRVDGPYLEPIGEVAAILRF